MNDTADKRDFDKRTSGRKKERESEGKIRHTFAHFAGESTYAVGEETVMRCEFANDFLGEDAALLRSSPIRRPDGVRRTLPTFCTSFGHHPTTDIRGGEGEVVERRVEGRRGDRQK